MSFFSRRRRVHLSPRLARSIGKNTNTKFSQIGKLGLVLVVLAILFVGRSQKSDLLSQTNAAQEQASGEVLGTQDSKVLDYTVLGGDTLIEISQKYNVYWMTIVEENELESPYKLKPGDKLRIPLPRN